MPDNLYIIRTTGATHRWRDYRYTPIGQLSGQSLTGNVTTITNPDGYTIRFEYDANNRPTRAFEEHGRAMSTDYDI